MCSGNRQQRPNPGSLGIPRNGRRFEGISRVWGLLSVTAAAFVGFENVRSAEPLPKPAQEEQVTVTGQATGSLTSASSEESATQKTQIPGGFTVKSTDEMRMGRASNFEDLLQRAPGVFLQSDGGTEASKISVRGSGITSEDEPIGVMFLLDGLSYNQADGETILEDFDVNTLGRGFFATRRHSNTGH